MFRKSLFFFLLSGLWVWAPSSGIAQSVTGIATEFTHATDCRSGVTTAIQGQKCIDLDDFTQWYCAAPTGGASETLCDEADDWRSVASNFTGVPVGTDPNDQRALNWTITTGSVTSTPNFSNETGLRIGFVGLHGQNDRDTAGKKTFLPLAVDGQYFAMGQRFGQSTNIDCFGMGDCFLTADHVTSAAGVSDGGGEGTAFRTMQLSQQTSLAKTTITAIATPSTCNTTLTQAVTRNIATQAVTVADDTGCVVGDWLTVDRGQIYFTDGKVEAVKLTAVGSGTVSAIFRHSHLSGAPLTPATVMTLASSSRIGEHRYLVNLTASAVTAGTVSATSGTGLTGSGTSWANNMVGGDATLPGCIALTSDDYTASPFSVPNTLKSWYGILSVTSATALNVAHRSAVGLVSYSGNGAGDYTVRPCARIMTLLTNTANTALTNQIVLETNTFTWTVGDQVEIAISVDGDASGEFTRVAWYTPGAALRGVYSAWNNGAQRWSSGLRVMGSPTNIDQAFSNGVNIEGKVDIGFVISGVSASGAMDLAPRAVGDNKQIKWGSRYIGPPTTDNSGLDIQTTSSGVAGKLSFTPPSVGDSLPTATWGGHLDLYNSPSTGQQPRLRFLQTSAVMLSLAMTASGIHGSRGLDLSSTDYLSGARPLLELLSSGTNGVVASTTNSLNDAVNGTNYASAWQSARASVWNGSAATPVYFSQRLSPAAGTNGVVTWEFRAGTNISYASNPVVLSVSDAGLVKTGVGGLQYTTGTRPTCSSTTRGSTFYVAGGSGVLDTFELCRKDASDVYAWVSLL